MCVLVYEREETGTVSGGAKRCLGHDVKGGTEH